MKVTNNIFNKFITKKKSLKNIFNLTGLTKKK